MNSSSPSTSRPLACFDIDGTLFRSSLLIALTEQLIKDEVFPPEVKDMYHQQHLAWLDRESTYEDYIQAVIDAFLHHIKGVHYGALADASRRVASVHQHRVYRYTRDLIKDLQQRGYFLVAISQSPKTILDVFCQTYQFDKVYGRIYEIGPQDRFLGTVAEEHLISDKASIVQRILDRHPDVTAEGAVAIGDTEGDISLLQMVARPICFNPNQALYSHAVQAGWEVVVERKDVIYTIA